MLRFLAKALISLIAFAVLTVGYAWWHFLPPTPDAFYTWPLEANLKPGTLIKQEVFTRNIPAGTKAWRILYQTTRHDGSPAVASAVVVTPTTPTVPGPIIAWAHGAVGVARGCAPSMFENPFPYIPAFPELFREGWTYFGTDYTGLGTPGGHAFLMGDDAARNVLDSVRAARQIPGLALNGQTLVWGHSQGGNSALWTGMTAAAYAPDVPLAGVAALSPASDLAGLMQEGKSLPLGKVLSAFALQAYTERFKELKPEDLANGWSRFWGRDMARRCVGNLGTLLSVAEGQLLAAEGIFKAEAFKGPLSERLKQQTPALPIPIPLLIGHGTTDDLISVQLQQRYVKSRCAAGQALDYREYGDRDHLTVVAADSLLVKDLLEWSRDRLAGKPAVTRCPL